MTIRADNPIRTREQDRLGRAPLARTLATEIRSLDASEGCVVGILGPWGSGKTSLVHLVREELSEDSPLPVLEFNPWLFSGSDQLLEAFFLDVGAQFRDRGARLADLATDIEAYAEVVAPLKWLPIVGMWVERARSVTKAVKKAAERRRGGVLAQRERLARKLQALDRPIVIVIDDIDRLRTQEIREIFKLVRLTASFPNIIYLLAFDVNAPAVGNLAVGEGYQKLSYPFGIMVNVHGQRFVDEGADFRNYTYATYGKAILGQPRQLAWQIFDHKMAHLLRDEYRTSGVTKVVADLSRRSVRRWAASTSSGSSRPSESSTRRPTRQRPSTPTSRTGAGRAV